MKRFFRTITGKTLVFIVCILSVITLVLSAFGVFYLVTEETGIYRLPKEPWVEQCVTREVIKPYGYVCVQEAYGIRGDNYGDAAFRVTDKNGKELLSSGASGVSEWKYSLVYGIQRNEQGEFMGVISYGTDFPEVEYDDEYCRLELNVLENTQLEERIRYVSLVTGMIWEMRYWVYGILAASVVIMVVSFISLMSLSGHVPEHDEVVRGPLAAVPYDLMVAGAVILWLSVVWFGEGSFFAFAPLFLVALCVTLGLCMSAAARIKRNEFWQGTITFLVLKYAWKLLKEVWKLILKFFKWCGELLRGIPLVWKTALAASVISFAELILVMALRYSEEGLLLIFLAIKTVLIAGVVWIALCLKKLQKCAAMMASGDLSYQVDTKGMFWDLKQSGEDLNHISEGIGAAVEQRMKSEHMKTELITNVSHDLKTPLTSVINYASLIAQEKTENEKITEYSAVLVRQSEKLKRLIDDLVEASKASTGNLEVILAPCDAGVLVQQAAGEYEDKLKAAELTLVTKLPQDKVTIMADGRRMWRIFDNLMNNITKYSQAGTRVYVSLEKKDNNAVFTFRNTSREELDMSPEELMERFTRGDSSRHTEGSGLGLSIARSMAELQHGTLDLSIDGDLFKVVMVFPAV